MKYNKICDCCGQGVVAYTHNINRPIVEAFIRLVEYYQDTRSGVNINQDLGLTHNQKCNLPKLQYYGLIRRTPEGWFPTIRGMMFYFGEIPVLAPVATLGNEVIPDNHEAWDTHEKSRKSIMIGDIVETHYKPRSAYQQEKSNQLGLL